MRPSGEMNQLIKQLPLAMSEQDLPAVHPRLQRLDPGNFIAGMRDPCYLKRNAVLKRLLLNVSDQQFLKLVRFNEDFFDPLVKLRMADNRAHEVFGNSLGYIRNQDINPSRFGMLRHDYYR